MTSREPAYVPSDLGQVIDQLGFMMLASPKFADVEFPEQNVESVFYQLDHGIEAIRSDLSEEQRERLVESSRRMKELFLADPEDKLSESIAGRDLIYDMMEMLEEVERQQMASDTPAPR